MCHFWETGRFVTVAADLSHPCVSSGCPQAICEAQWTEVRPARRTLGILCWYDQQGRLLKHWKLFTLWNTFHDKQVNKSSSCEQLVPQLCHANHSKVAGAWCLFGCRAWRGLRHPGLLAWQARPLSFHHSLLRCQGWRQQLPLLPKPVSILSTGPEQSWPVFCWHLPSLFA